MEPTHSGASIETNGPTSPPHLPAGHLNSSRADDRPRAERDVRTACEICIPPRHCQCPLAFLAAKPPHNPEPRPPGIGDEFAYVPRPRRPAVRALDSGAWRRPPLAGVAVLVANGAIAESPALHSRPDDVHQLPLSLSSSRAATVNLAAVVETKGRGKPTEV